MSTKNNSRKSKNSTTFTINQLLFVQAHIGNKTSKWNPLTKSFLFGSRHNVHFFNLKQTIPYLKRMVYLLTRATSNHQVILFVGTHPFVSVLIQFLAKNTKQSSITREWVAGTLTNWRRIGPYVRYLYKTNIEKIRKRFVLKTEKKIEQKIAQYLKMKYLLFGIERMPAVPNIVVLFERDLKAYPLLEAFKLMVPIISVINTGPQSGVGISYPIFGNDYFFDSLYFYGTLILQAIKSGLMQKRLVFFKSMPFTKIARSKKKREDYKVNFDAYMLQNYNFFLRFATSYKALALKRLLRKKVFLVNLTKKSRLKKNPNFQQNNDFKPKDLKSKNGFKPKEFKSKSGLKIKPKANDFKVSTRVNIPSKINKK